MRNLTLLTDFYQLTMMNGYLKCGTADREAVFDVFYRGGAELSYVVTAGLEQVVEYIVQNGMMKDLSVLQEAPFTDQGSIVDIFTDLTIWMGIRHVIEQVNANALVAQR